jgi:hypothetical protein
VRREWIFHPRVNDRYWPIVFNKSGTQGSWEGQPQPFKIVAASYCKLYYLLPDLDWFTVSRGGNHDAN